METSQPSDGSHDNLRSLLERGFSHFISPLEIFIQKQATGSLLLIAFTFVALIIANSPWNQHFLTFASTEAGLIFGTEHFSLSIYEWVSHALMSLFFFLVGLEIKREILAGKLQDTREVILLCFAALGGILVPALIYYVLNANNSGAHGWAIPTATDTAFAIGVLALMSRQVSVGLTIFLTALAIFDDIGATVILSLFYTDEFKVPFLIYAVLVLAALFLGNRLGIRLGVFYGCLGVLLWILILESGLHPTVAGLLLALTIPARPVISQSRFILEIKNLVSQFEKKQINNASMLGSSAKHSVVSDIAASSREASTPLQRWEIILISPIAVIVLPLFALFNAGFTLTPETIHEAVKSPVTHGIIAGLFLGKPIGIIVFSLIGLRTGWGKLPEGVSFRELVAAALLAGIGFTMSIFFTTVSFSYDAHLLEFSKIGILLASALSAIGGIVWIQLMIPKNSITN